MNRILCLVCLALTISCGHKGESKMEYSRTNVNYKMTNQLFDSISIDQKGLIERFFKFMNDSTIDEGKNFFYLKNICTSADCDAIVKIIAQELVKCYKPVDTSTFNNRIKQFVGFDLEAIPNKLIGHVHSNNCIELELENGYNNIWICKKEHIIIPSSFVWLKFDNPYDINTIDLSIDTNIVHYNRYIFNDSEAAFLWLKNNDEQFLKDLLLTFGYDKDNKINKLVLDSTPKGSDNSYTAQNFENIFAAKDANNKLHIRENLLKYIKENPSNDYVNMLYTYGSYSIKGTDTNFTKEEWFEIAAYMVYYLRLIYLDNSNRSDNQYIVIDDMLFREIGDLVNEKGNPSDEGDDSKFLKAIIRNKYYNLPGFEEMVDDILSDCRIPY